MINRFPFEVHTPYRRFFAQEVEAIIIPLIDGEIGVYANHAFFIAPVQTGTLKIKDKTATWRYAFITEGIIEVKGHNTILLVDAAEWPEEIDIERCNQAKAKAEEQIRSAKIRFEIDEAQAALKRANARIKLKQQSH
ncbi:MAG: ATP synthase F1 subunit epsilon [Treponema sp.]|jgi:F-type H+-transporting ATPase subunit epsilon|nr:ATP synthase F1 subunit epsilon [Treponema sp.]